MTDVIIPKTSGNNYITLIAELTNATYEKISQLTTSGNKIDPRYTMILCHNNAMIDKFVELKVPCHHEKRVEYKNKFLEDFRKISDLREANFDPTDSSRYAMTYGQAAKIMRYLHVNIALRAERREAISGAKICMATHIILMDSWFPSRDVAVFLHIYNLLLSYGCAMPNLIHVSQGPMLTSSLSFKTDNTRINIAGELNVTGSTPNFPAMMKNMAPMVLKYRCNYVVVPDAYIGKMLAADIKDVTVKYLLDPRTDFQVCIVFFDQILLTSFEGCENLIIVPFLRRGSDYIPMSRQNIVSIISLPAMHYVGTATSRTSMQVYVGNGGKSISVGINELISQNEIDIDAFYSSEFYKLLSSADQVKLVCDLALSSVQPTMLESAVKEAVRLKYVEAVDSTVVSVTPLGTFYHRANLNSKLIKFLVDWQRTTYPLFAAFCAIAVIERAMESKPNLININLLTEEQKFPDPFVHQLQIISDYVSDHGLKILGTVEMEDFARPCCANPKVLIEIIVRIISLHCAGISTNRSYGPFDPAKLVKILYDNKFFPIAKPPTSSPDHNKIIYIAENGNEKVYYTKSPSSIYDHPSEILAIHSELLVSNNLLEKNSRKYPELILYAGISKSDK